MMLTALSGGLTNRSWRVQIDDNAAAGESWVLRKFNPQARELGIDREQEAAVLRQVSAAGISPELLQINLNAGFSLSQYISSNHWRLDSLANTDQSQRMLAVLGKLHQLPLTVNCLSVEHQVEGYLQQLPSSLPYLKLFTGGMAGVLQRLASPPMSCLCHNDLNPGNLIDDGKRIWLVDWEYASGGDPLFDLAVILRTHHASESICLRFLSDWLQLIPYPLSFTDAWHRLEDQLLMVDWLGWLWAHVRMQQNAGAGGWPQRSERFLLQAFG